MARAFRSSVPASRFTIINNTIKNIFWRGLRAVYHLGTAVPSNSALPWLLRGARFPYVEKIKPDLRGLGVLYRRHGSAALLLRSRIVQPREKTKYLNEMLTYE